MEFLWTADSAAFVFLNQDIANPVTDWLMPLITNDILLRVGLILSLAFVLWKSSPEIKWIVAFIGLALLISDQLVSSVLKPLISRPRPCHDNSALEFARLLVNCGAGWSLPSAHAANAFAVAGVSVFAVRNSWRYLFPLAIIIALSRVFVGVHYPGDIFLGAVIGGLCGVGAGLLYLNFLIWMRSSGRLKKKPEFLCASKQI